MSRRQVLVQLFSHAVRRFSVPADSTFVEFLDLCQEDGIRPSVVQYSIGDDWAAISSEVEWKLGLLQYLLKESEISRRRHPLEFRVRVSFSPNSGQSVSHEVVRPRSSLSGLPDLCVARIIEFLSDLQVLANFALSCHDFHRLVTEHPRIHKRLAQVARRFQGDYKLQRPSGNLRIQQSGLLYSLTFSCWCRSRRVSFEGKVSISVVSDGGLLDDAFWCPHSEADDGAGVKIEDERRSIRVLLLRRGDGMDSGRMGEFELFGRVGESGCIEFRLCETNESRNRERRLFEFEKPDHWMIEAKEMRDIRFFRADSEVALHWPFQDELTSLEADMRTTIMTTGDESIWGNEEIEGEGEGEVSHSSSYRSLWGFFPRRIVGIHPTDLDTVGASASFGSLPCANDAVRGVAIVMDKERNEELIVVPIHGASLAVISGTSGRVVQKIAQSRQASLFSFPLSARCVSCHFACRSGENVMVMSSQESAPSVEVWNLANEGEHVSSLVPEARRGGTLTPAAICLDNHLVIATDSSGVMWSWDLQTLEGKTSAGTSLRGGGFCRVMRPVSVLGEFVFAGFGAFRMALYDVRTPSLVVSRALLTKRGHFNAYQVGLEVDDCLVVSAGDEIVAWDLRNPSIEFARMHPHPCAHGFYAGMVGVTSGDVSGHKRRYVSSHVARSEATLSSWRLDGRVRTLRHWKGEKSFILLRQSREINHFASAVIDKSGLFPADDEGED